MADTTHEAHEPTESGATHVGTPRMYLLTYAALMILLFLTWYASTFNFGPANIVIALIIAIVKTSLVVLFFMGVKFQSKLTWLWASLGFIWVLLLFGTMGDYITREWIRLPEGW